MTSPHEPAPSRRRPGPKARGRSVVPLTITVTPAQRAALEELADARRVSISAVIRQFIVERLAADTVGGRGMDRWDDLAREPATIVVIDDDPRIVAFASLVLEDEGYRVAAWHAGAGARDFIARERPAAVLLDVELETRDAGLRVRKQIADEPSLRAIPVILASSRAGSVPDKAGQAGPQGDPVLVKPYTPEALIATIAQAVAARQRGHATDS